jgi:hypothetical protein
MTLTLEQKELYERIEASRQYLINGDALDADMIELVVETAVKNCQAARRACIKLRNSPAKVPPMLLYAIERLDLDLVHIEHALKQIKATNDSVTSTTA